MKVYKFRSLENQVSYERAIDILTTGRFRFSRYWEMNDPMEGLYKGSKSLSDETASIVFGEKANRLICCFSREIALRNPLMWGYYTHGFKGAAIEVEIDRTQLTPIVYSNQLIRYANVGTLDQRVTSIPSRKLKCWKHEREVRAFQFNNDDPNQLYPVGTVTGVVLGMPYPRKFFQPDVFGRWEYFRNYECQAEGIAELARENNLKVSWAFLRSGRIRIEDLII